jgi:hypothetical protein
MNEGRMKKVFLRWLQFGFLGSMVSFRGHLSRRRSPETPLRRGGNTELESSVNPQTGTSALHGPTPLMVFFDSIPFIIDGNRRGWDFDAVISPMRDLDSRPL